MFSQAHGAGGTTTTNETKAASFAQVGAREMKRLNEQLRDLVVGHQINGGRDMTGREIQRAYEARYGKRIESGTVSGAVNRLVAAGVLARRDVTRACAVTGRAVLPVYAVARQASLV